MQGEPVLAVLDVGLAGHGVEVGLQGELGVAAAGLDLHHVTKQTKATESEFTNKNPTLSVKQGGKVLLAL